MRYYQQGDVLLKKIEELPGDLTEIKGKVLQEGETTGHKHQFKTNAGVKLFQKSGEHPLPGLTITPNGLKYIHVQEVSLLYHEEHKSISVEPGVYEIDIVREFDYDKNEMARVVD